MAKTNDFETELSRIRCKLLGISFLLASWDASTAAIDQDEAFGVALILSDAADEIERILSYGKA